MKNLLDLSSKIAIVTGASSGMGAEIARVFAEQGAKVIALARRKDRLESLAKENENIIPFSADVTKEEDCKNVVKFTTEKFGKIDILVNNAGIMDDMLPIERVTDETWENVINVNLTGVMRLTRAVIPFMLQAKAGSIINTASVGGLFGGRAGVAYTASKHGVIGFTKNTAFMYSREGIRCNAICPGAVATEIAQASMKNPDKEGLSKTMAGIVLNPRTGEPREIANIALFLASDASSIVSGATITADSGWSTY